MSAFGNLSVSQSTHAITNVPFTYGREMIDQEPAPELNDVRAFVPERSELEELLQTVARVAQEKCLPGAAAFGAMPKLNDDVTITGASAAAADFTSLADLLGSNPSPTR